MPTRKLIIRLDGKSLDGMEASLLVYELDGTIEFVATEEHGPDAAVVLEHVQATELAQALTAALKCTGGENAS